MPWTDTTTVLQRPVSRRTLVASGTKLAYTAPLIAASFRLTQLTAQAEGAVSGPDDTNNPGLFPPAIESVTFSAPGWVLISGRGLSDAAVTFATSRGNIKARTRGKSKKGEIEGLIEVNTDEQIIVTIPDEITIFTTTVETPDGVDILDKKVKPPHDEDKPEKAPKAEEQQAAPAEDEPAEDVQVEDPAPAEQPVQNEPVQEQPAAEPPATEEPVEAPPAEPPPVEQAPTEEPVQVPPTEEPPVEEAPAEEPAAAEESVETPKPKQK